MHFRVCSDNLSGIRLWSPLGKGQAPIGCKTAKKENNPASHVYSCSLGMLTVQGFRITGWKPTKSDQRNFHFPQPPPTQAYLRESRRTRGGARPLGWSVSSAFGSTEVWVIGDDLLGRADNSHARSRNRRKWLRWLSKMLVRSSAIWEGEKIKAATIISANTFLPQFVFIPFQACLRKLSSLEAFAGISLWKEPDEGMFWSLKLAISHPHTAGFRSLLRAGLLGQLTVKHSELPCPCSYCASVFFGSFFL